jgi:hypothetical protein
MDIIQFTKQVKENCHFLVPPEEKHQRKECMDTMMCPWNNCQKELQDVEKAQLNEEERKSCKNKDFNKEIDCNQKLIEKKGLMDKIAMQAHCEANKCPNQEILRKKYSRT